MDQLQLTKDQQLSAIHKHTQQKRVKSYNKHVKLLCEHLSDEFGSYKNEIAVVIVYDRDLNILGSKIVGVGNCNSVTTNNNVMCNFINSCKGAKFYTHVHNHPGSGFHAHHYPSFGDRGNVVKKLRSNNNVTLLDHLIVTQYKTRYFSFRSMDQVISARMDPLPATWSCKVTEPLYYTEHTDRQFKYSLKSKVA